MWAKVINGEITALDERAPLVIGDVQYVLGIYALAEQNRAGWSIEALRELGVYKVIEPETPAGKQSIASSLVFENGEVVRQHQYADIPVDPSDFQVAIDRRIEAVAAERSYSSAVSLASYVASSIPLWQAEAQAFVAWRDAVWTYSLAELAKVQAGQREAPATTAAFVAELPVIEWPEA